MAGGAEGKKGNQYIINPSGSVEQLLPLDCRKVQAGDRIVIETPGGGGWGSPGDDYYHCKE